MPIGPCDHGPMRRVLTLVLVLGAGATGCSSGQERDLASYYDPEGLFVAHLHEANVVTVAPPQPAPSGPSLLTGVISQPPAPSASPQAQFGGGLAQGLGQTTQPSDQTVYEAFVVTTDDFEPRYGDVLTGIDLRRAGGRSIDGTAGRLVVADASGTEVRRAWQPPFARSRRRRCGRRPSRRAPGTARRRFLRGGLLPRGGQQDANLPGARRTLIASERQPRGRVTLAWGNGSPTDSDRLVLVRIRRPASAHRLATPIPDVYDATGGGRTTRRRGR
jgi:hypothetical protein